jgi:hypothetical protein
MLGLRGVALIQTQWSITQAGAKVALKMSAVCGSFCLGMSAAGMFGSLLDECDRDL